MALPCMAMTEIPGQAGNDGRCQAGNDETVMADLIGHLVDEEIPGQAGNDGRGQAWNDGTVKVTDVYGFAVNIAKVRVFNQKLKRK